MNSQRGKASTQASRQNKSKTHRQALKSKTNESNPKPYRNRRSEFSGAKTQPQRSVAAAYSTGQSQGDPIITRGPNFVRIVHKELVANIIGSVAYTVSNTFPLNPGMTTFLKWLPTQAVGWETYKWNKLEFKAFTRTGSNVPGSLAIIPDYDASDSAPSDEFSASSYKDLEEDVPWKDICCKLPNARLHPMGKQLFLRYGTVSNTDIKTYDAGNVFVTTTDGTAVPWSKLWAYYDVTLYTPQLPSGGIVALSNTLHIYGTVPTSANAFPNQTVGAGSNAAIATVPVTGEIITFNSSGKFLVAYGTECTTSITYTGAPAVSASGSLVTSYFSTLDSFPGGYVAAGSGSTVGNMTIILTAIAGTTLTLNNTIVLGLGYDLVITALSSITV